ncbi:adenylate/guanylate cyclase domain-containing protein [Motiliproteus sediminis]|uniref:adenylate/guanylate cyclase domain-containing protein n=1 Tax=Motiliproteus sediminis TaxID=1468178 RepID=UPI001AEFA55F|nr:adenylate/guanylate cyclase domain-containing protein [Motiliproteus sediminis]
MVRNLRLFTGVVLAVFVVLHLLNHALGLASLDAMEAVRQRLAAAWGSPPLKLLLYGSLLTHVLLAYYALYRRSTLRMPLWEAAQLILGLAIPPLLLVHLIGTRVTMDLMGVEVEYRHVITALWSLPNQVERQTALILVVWAHLLIGLHYWLRLKQGYRQVLGLWQVLATLVPMLALMGFYRIGWELGTVDMAARKAALVARDPDTMAFIGGLESLLMNLYLGGLLLVVLARYARAVYRVNFGSVMVEHPERGVIAAPAGETLLDALRGAGVDHSSVCGGRARCTTCRVRVTRGLEQLAPPGDAERRALEGIRADAATRLACQLRVNSDIAVIPLIPPGYGMDYVRRPGGIEGKEQAVAVLFVDLRDSTRLGEQRLPYDVVFILNQFFAEMSAALVETNGHYAQFNGDGLMALYGLEGDIQTACQDALRGAQSMFRRLESLNQRLQRELEQPLRIGIGIHCGEAVVGTMGPPSSPLLSAVGDTVNTAARLESQSKPLKVPLLVSLDVITAAGVDYPGDIRQLPLRGRYQPIDVMLVTHPQQLEISQSSNQPFKDRAYE